MRSMIFRRAARLLLSISCVMLGFAAVADDKLTMNMRDADIRALIQWVADNTGRNIIVHKDVAGQVTVLSPQPLTPAEAYQVFLSVLQVHGYAAVETPEALKILPRSLANTGLPISGTEGADMVVSVLKINNLSAVKLAEMLRPMVSKEAVLTPYTETNVLVIADHAANIDEIRNLIAQLDRPGDNEIELIRLQYANAADVLESLSALIPDTGSNGELRLNLSVDERSNSILMTGDGTRRKQIRKLVTQLDSPLHGQGNTQVVYLHYVKADELVPILKNLAQSIQKTQKDTSNGISIEASESANALVINAPPALLSTMKRVIGDLDIRRAQILVEALIVEVSGDVASDLGVQWFSAASDDRDDNVVAAVNTLGDLDLVDSVVTDADGNITSVVPGRGFTFGYYNNGDLQAAIRALDQNRNANILSTPTIVAIDNEEASLLVGQNVPFRTGQSTGSASSTDNPFTTIERQDIGISLVVTPRINRGDAITLDIQQKTESIAPSLATAADIITEKREILTKALIQDDQILVLGGLISDEESEVKEKVPLLGDIPLIGRLFSSTSKSRTKKNLMVFIHPVILKGEAQLAEVTKRRYNFMRELQQSVRRKEWRVEHTKSPVLDDFDTYLPSKSTGDAIPKNITPVNK